MDIPHEPQLNGDLRDESLTPAGKSADDEEPVYKSADQPRVKPSSTVIRADRLAAASDLDKIMEFIAKRCNAAVDSGECKGMISMAFLKVFSISIFSAIRSCFSAELVFKVCCCCKLDFLQNMMIFPIF